MEFEWDEAKARDNLLRHGVSIEVASTVFHDPQLVLAEDKAHSVRERRHFAFGRVGSGVLTVRFTIRGRRIRMIGAGYWRKGKELSEKANRLHR